MTPARFVRRAAALLAVATLAAACGGTVRGGDPRPIAGRSSGSATQSQAARPLRSGDPSLTRNALVPRDVVTAQLARLAARLPAGAVSVAALNTDTGARYRYGAAAGMWMGSVYKLLVLEELLLRRQRGGYTLSDAEIDDATAMIERSDNPAGYRMYLDAGGAGELMSSARRLGLRHLRVGVADPALTSVGAADGIAMLRAVVTRDGPLSGASRAFVLRLMRHVESDQRWGVGVVADPGSTVAIKNGWMDVDGNGPDEDDAGRWLVNSIGIVQVGGQQLLLAIFTRHNPDLDTGIHLVERLSRIVTSAVASRSR